MGQKSTLWVDSVINFSPNQVHKYIKANEQQKYLLGYGTQDAPACAITVTRKTLLIWTPFILQMVTADWMGGSKHLTLGITAVHLRQLPLVTDGAPKLYQLPCLPATTCTQWKATALPVGWSARFLDIWLSCLADIQQPGWWPQSVWCGVAL